MVDLDAYFARIGYDGPRAPTLEVLATLHALHPAAVTFEAIDCLLDRGVDISPAAVDAKIIGRRRGGYCFEQNSLFARVLTALGFEVTGLWARVRWNLAPDAPAPPRTHQVLKVEVETESDGRQSFLADVGFGGCALTAPMRFAPHHETVTRHDVYRLTPTGDELRLEVLRKPGFVPVYDLSLTPCESRDYEMANWFTSTHPDSHFRHNLLAARTTLDARYGLFFNHFVTRPVGGDTIHETLDADGIEHHLRETFGLPVEAAWRPLFEKAAEGPPG